MACGHSTRRNFVFVNFQKEYANKVRMSCLKQSVHYTKTYDFEWIGDTQNGKAQPLTKTVLTFVGKHAARRLRGSSRHNRPHSHISLISTKHCRYKNNQ